MNRGDAYNLLSPLLNGLRGEGYNALVLRVDQRATSQTVWVNGEPVVVETQIIWNDRETRSLHLCAAAYGPSTWKFERLDESFVMKPDSANK